jgi:hypothetical protein
MTGITAKSRVGGEMSPGYEDELFSGLLRNPEKTRVDRVTCGLLDYCVIQSGEGLTYREFMKLHSSSGLLRNPLVWITAQSRKNPS